MTGTLRRRRSRNPYREVLLTYCRWRFVWVAVFFLPALTLQGSPSRLADFFPIVFPAMGVSGQLLSHLAQFFGSPRGRLTPGLGRAHFVVAGAWIAIFAVLVPFEFSLLLVDGGGQRFTIVAVSFASVALFCLFMQNSGLRWLLFGLVFLLDKLGHIPIDRSLSWFESVGLCGLGVLSLIGAAVKISHFDAENTVSTERWLLQRAVRLIARTVYFVRLQFNRRVFAVGRASAGRGSRVDVDGGEELRQVPPLRAATSARLRALGGGAPGPGEGLWRRARHWAAAWQITGNMTAVGAISGGALIVLDRVSARADFYWCCAILVGLLPIIAICFGAFLLFSELRTRLLVEFLRPYSREQFVQAVGLAILVALGRFILLAVAVPGIVVWLCGGLTHTGQALWFAVAVIAWLPVFLGASLANRPSWETNFWVILWLVLYGIFLILCAANAGEFESYPMALLSATLLVVGLLNLRGAYRTWLNRDPEEGRIF
jgi:hypothetical protein